MIKDSQTEIWSQEDQKYFFERFLQAENNQPQYLLSKAFELFVYNEPLLNDNILMLLNKYFNDFPNDIDNMSPALLLMGKIHYSQNEFDKAFDFFKKAAEFEIKYPDIICGAWLFYAEIIVKLEKIELFDEAEKFININYEKLDYLEGSYTANAILAFISEKKGNFEKQRYYRKQADDVLNNMMALDKRLRYVSVVKVCETNKDLGSKIKCFLKEKEFTFGQRNGAPVWFKKGPFCLHHIMPYYLFDVVLIVAFISFKDALTNIEQEAGLKGFIACMGKIPLKKIVKQFEKILKNQKNKVSLRQ